MDFLTFPLPRKVEEEKARGNISSAEKIIEYYLSQNIPVEMRRRLEYEKFRIKLIKKDYGISPGKAVKILMERLNGMSREELEEYRNEGFIDYIILDGKVWYFNRFIDNLLFLRPDLKIRMKQPADGDKNTSLVNDAIARISKGEKYTYRVVAGIRITMKKRGFYRVWLPFPVENSFSRNVRLIKASHNGYSISDDMGHRTIYMQGEGKTFYAEFYYEISEVHGEGERYVPMNDYYKQEKLPHVHFTPYLRYLAKTIAGDESDPVENARRIYRWIVSHVRYTYVPEYIIFDNIGEYTAANLRGDCGMQALLFITLCRILGIGAKWQSGWFITPYFVSPHDWAQVYTDDGWIPVDPSFGNEFKGQHGRSDFYFGSLDAFRMVANEDFQRDFIPPKKFFRSDPVDNQRGEVENEEGNVYFDTRKVKMYVKKFERIG